MDGGYRGVAQEVHSESGKKPPVQKGQEKASGDHTEQQVSAQDKPWVCWFINDQPMKSVLDDYGKPVKVKFKNYLVEQKTFLDVCFVKLIDIDFLRPCPEAAWQAVPDLVSKAS